MPGGKSRGRKSEVAGLTPKPLCSGTNYPVTAGPLTGGLRPKAGLVEGREFLERSGFDTVGTGAEFAGARDMFCLGRIGKHYDRDGLKGNKEHPVPWPSEAKKTGGFQRIGVNRTKGNKFSLMTAKIR